MSNPLLQEFNTPYGTAPFNHITTTHFKPAVVELIKETHAEIDAITRNPDTPTFENTLEVLEFSGLQLNQVTSIFFKFWD